MRSNQSVVAAWIGGVLLALSSAGCATETCLAGCAGDLVSLSIELRPAIDDTYDVELSLDGNQGSFTCEESRITNQRGTGQVAIDCSYEGFSVVATPQSVEVFVEATNEDWTGSFNGSPNYERVPRCPGGDRLCPPFATITVEQDAI